MLQVYGSRQGEFRVLERQERLPSEAVWIDLVEPTPEEDKQVEGWLGTSIPTREEMQEVEESSRLYQENGAVYMTALVVWRADANEPINTPISFILTAQHLVTVRYADPQPFRTFLARCAKQPETVTASDSAFIALLDAIVDRAADLLERVGADLESVSGHIFRRENAGGRRRRRFARRRPADLQAIILRIGEDHDLATKVRESLLSLDRLLIFFSEAGEAVLQRGKGLRAHLKTLSRDIRSLNEHAAYLEAKETFLLDAALGLINIQQNAIIKIVSVMAVIFMPPTLVASIYGMNFDFMPELKWEHGYPFALLLMVASAVMPYLFFKLRKWL
jgi:magnesium transporter